MSNNFDPSKLNIDFLGEKEDKNIEKDNVSDIDNTEKIPAKEKNTSFDNDKNLFNQENDLFQNKNEIEDNENQKDKEKIEKETKESVDKESLNTILTDSDIRPEEFKKEDREKEDKLEKENTINTTPKQKIIFDINIKSIDDLIHIITKELYDFVIVEPKDEYAEIKFKKDGVIKKELYVKLQVYSSLILNAKKISKLKVDEINIEQKGEGEYKFKNKDLITLSKIVPGDFGEILFFKIKNSDKHIKVKKSGIGLKSLMSFLAAALMIALIVGGAFLAFIVLNARTVEDVSFFQNLGINLNDINNFLLTTSGLVFGFLIFILTTFLIIFSFKAILTKKIYKRKKNTSMILSIFFLIITFITGGVWMQVDATIRAMPNWQEMARGNIQIYDNNLLVSPLFSDENALITNFSNIIGPIDIKFDLNYYKRAEERKGLKINNYVWDIDGDIIETTSPEIIHEFNNKGNHNISLTINQTDRSGREIEKIVSDIPNIEISQLVEININTLSNGGKTIELDASELSRLGRIEWYMQDDPNNYAHRGETFRPSRVFFDEEVIGLKIVDNDGNKKGMDKLFLISGNSSNIDGEIVYEVSIQNDLTYTFSVDNLETNFGEGFIESYKWTIEGTEKNIPGIIGNENSPSITHTFDTYGPQNISVTLKNSSGKSSTINKEVNIPRKLNLANKPVFKIDGNEIENIENIEYIKDTKEYFLYDIATPYIIEIDGRRVRSENNAYVLKEIKWDIGNNGDIEHTGFNLEHEIHRPGDQAIAINYTFENRRDKTDKVEKKEYIYLEGIEKDINLILDIKAESEYAPTIVGFDASRSRVKGERIVKYIYDYGNGVIEERDGINKGHRYLRAGTYEVKLTVVTENGNEHSISRTLVLRNQPSEANITTSLRRAPTFQEISFSSSESTGHIVGHSWDFGDGNFSNKANPSHFYSRPGVYEVKLTLDFANNNVLTDTVEVTIE